MKRKICDRCFREYFEEDERASPVEELGRIFLGALKDRDGVNFCPKCRKELGIVNLLGFGQ